MTRWATFLVLLAGMTLVTCISGERSNMFLVSDDNPVATGAVQGEPSDLNSQVDPAHTTVVDPQINLKTDSTLYSQGETVVATIENNSANSISFMENCSLHLCFESGDDWICEERECDGPTIVLGPRSHLEILQEAETIFLQEKADTNSRYKLDYQIVSEDPFYFAHSNEFTVQSTGLNGK